MPTNLGIPYRERHRPKVGLKGALKGGAEVENPTAGRYRLRGSEKSRCAEMAKRIAKRPTGQKWTVHIEARTSQGHVDAKLCEGETP
jgi:hypothetical protein